VKAVFFAQKESQMSTETHVQGRFEHLFENLGAPGQCLGRLKRKGYKTGDRVELLINDRVRSYTQCAVSTPDSKRQ